ncbi:MAG: alpha-L-fucosidase [Armatimonadetes bacterium]|nr:alpha-L-fucosidase [Armatimonadota bacterium]
MLSLLIAMSITQDPPAPVGPLPSANQMAWHERQYYAFVHFGPNTFTGVEWGQGTEDPNIFNPTEFDARQWCRVFKEAGMTGVIITAKHHDGFALWPSKYTDHSVKASKWRDGKGDVLKDLSEACKEYGLWMGVYLSPWDRNHPTYGTAEYNDVFVNMLEEVLTNYGDMKEVWFDGANGEGPNGKRQIYDWPRFEATVREFAPNAVIFGDGGDVRWVGNESGFVGETNWNFLPSGHYPGDQSIYSFLFEGDPNGDKYSPGECDVSIRPGWFWRESENDRVKSIEQLSEIYYRSIGHGGNLLLNVPPDSRGLIHKNDVHALMEFRRWREETFEEDLSQKMQLDFENRPAGSERMVQVLSDHDPTTYYEVPRPKIGLVYALSWTKPTLVDHVVIQENLINSQRITHFSVWLFSRNQDSPYLTLARGTTVGYRRIVQFPPLEVKDGESLMVEVFGPGGVPIRVASIEAYLGVPSVEIASGAPSFMGEQTIELKSDNPFAEIRYTLDGASPQEYSPLYEGPIKIDKTVTLKAAAFYEGRRSFKPIEQKFTRYDKQELMPAIVFIRAPDPGLRYFYIEQGWQTLDQLKDAKETETGVSMMGLDLRLRKRDEHFGFKFQGVITAPKDGIYTFSLTSDDGSRLYIDDKLIVDNDGLHGLVTKQGMAPLAKGFHMIRVEYFNATGALGLKLEMTGPEIKKHEMRAEEFKH